MAFSVNLAKYKDYEIQMSPSSRLVLSVGGLFERGTPQEEILLYLNHTETHCTLFFEYHTKAKDNSIAPTCWHPSLSFKVHGPMSLRTF